MNLDLWIRSRKPRMSDTAFGQLMRDDATGLPAVTYQAVGYWRRGQRVPGAPYIARIETVTSGEVKEADLVAARKITEQQA